MALLSSTDLYVLFLAYNWNILPTAFPSVSGYSCPMTCNKTGHLTEGEDCGDFGFCCGSVYLPFCCTAYYDRIRPDPSNATQEDCDQMKAALASNKTTLIPKFSTTLL